MNFKNVTLFVLFWFFSSSFIFAQTAKKMTVLNQSNPELHVNQSYDKNTHSVYLNFDQLLTKGGELIEEEKLRAYIRAYPEMFTSTHAVQLRNTFPTVFHEEKERAKKLKKNSLQAIKE